MLNNVNVGSDDIDLVPDELVEQIDNTNNWVYELLNNGCYRCGFSTQQGSYDIASSDVRKGLNRAENILSQQNYLCGDVFTESDLRLLPTILRFDGAYSPLFRAGICIISCYFLYIIILFLHLTLSCLLTLLVCRWGSLTHT